MFMKKVIKLSTLLQTNLQVCRSKHLIATQNSLSSFASIACSVARLIQTSLSKSMEEEKQTKEDGAGQDHL